MDHEAIAVAVDVGGGVRLELDGDVCHGRVELEAGPQAPVLTQDLCRQVVTVVEGDHVILPYVKPRESLTQGTHSIAIAIYTVEPVKHVNEVCQCFCMHFCKMTLLSYHLPSTKRVDNMPYRLNNNR